MAEGPSHADIVRAAEATAKGSLIQLVSDASSYYTERASIAGLDGVEAYRVVPLEVSVPLDFIGVNLPDGFVFTSGYAPGVGKVLVHERTRLGADVARVVFELYRPRAADVRFVGAASDLPEGLRERFAAPSHTQNFAGLVGHFQVLDEGRLLVWAFAFGQGGNSINISESKAVTP